MQIEFIGLPGSGKTTLRRNLLAGLHQDGEVRCISSEDAFLQVARESIDRALRIPLKLLPRSLALQLAEKLKGRSLMQFEAQNRFLARHGNALEAFLGSATYRDMSNLDRQRVIGSFLGMGSIWQCTNSTSTQDKIVFHEEGLVQKSFMFVDHRQHGLIDKENVFAYLNGIPHSDLVIYISASVETSLSRMLSRPDGLTDRLKDSDEPAILGFLQSAKSHLDLVEAWFRDNRRDSMVLIDSESNDPQEFIALKEKIRALGKTG